MAAALAASDAELFSSPAWMTEAPAAFRAMFAQGLEGYADDDRLADGAGWITFDVASIRCPVTVLHFDDLGHFSITTKVVPAIRALPQRQRRSAEPGRLPAMSSRDIPLLELLPEGETASHSQAICGRTGRRSALPATLVAYTDHPFRAQHGLPRWLSDCRPYRRFRIPALAAQLHFRGLFRLVRVRCYDRPGR